MPGIFSAAVGPSTKGEEGLFLRLNGGGEIEEMEEEEEEEV